MMLYTIIKDNTYQDSIVLMLLSQKLSAMDGVNKASVMMGTPANKDIFKGAGLGTPELETASANDIVIVIDTDDESKVEEVDEAVETELAGGGGSDDSQKSSEAHNWKRALRSEEHTSELQSRFDLVCRLLLEKKKLITRSTLIILTFLFSLI